MNLNCMACSHCSRRSAHPTSKLSSSSSRHNNALASPSFSLWLGRMERTWSGSLGPRPDPTATDKMMKKSSSKIQSSHDGGGAAINGPRLVRCSAMKRDWSFHQDPRKAVDVGGFHKFSRY